MGKNRKRVAYAMVHYCDVEGRRVDPENWGKWKGEIGKGSHPWHDGTFKEVGRFRVTVDDEAGVVIENGWLSGPRAFITMGYPTPYWNGIDTPWWQRGLKSFGYQIPTWEDVLDDPLHWQFIQAGNYSEKPPEEVTAELEEKQREALKNYNGSWRFYAKSPWKKDAGVMLGVSMEATVNGKIVKKESPR